MRRKGQGQVTVIVTCHITVTLTKSSLASNCPTMVQMNQLHIIETIEIFVEVHLQW